MEEKQIRIAIVGHPLSGKDTVGDYLSREYGFTQVPTGALLRQYMAENQLGEPTRDRMQVVANDVRNRFGAGFFVEKALAGEYSRIAINGIRAIGEVKAARELGCTIIATVAPIEKRYEWARSRKGRISDNVSFEDFARQEKAESIGNSENEQSVDAAVATADYTIGNEKDLAHLFTSVDSLMSKLGIEKA